MWSVYREDGSEGGGLKVCESGAGIEDEAALARSIKVEVGQNWALPVQKLLLQRRVA